MSVVHPSPGRIEALKQRWIGQEVRLSRIAEALIAGEDWTAHLRGLPLIEEIAPLEGEAYGRDLRGADLRRFLVPHMTIEPAGDGEAAIVAGITLEAMRSNTPLPETSPFPAEFEGAEQMAVAIRRGETFLLARCARAPVGVVRIAHRKEFAELTGKAAYAEISGLAVLPEWRRNGVGKRLLDAAEQHALEDGERFVLLRTTMEVGLVPYYERLGYETRLVRQLQYAGSPAFLDVVLTKALPRRRVTTKARPTQTMV